MERFDDFMRSALYGPNGFYQAQGSAGRRGDFITSPEVGPLFGAVVGRFLDAEWARLGQPTTFTVIEFGAGPGTLARSIGAADLACTDAIDFVAVEVSDAQRGRHPDGIRSVACVDEAVADPVVGVVLANELLDNLPFRLAVYDDGWRDAFVTTDAASGSDRRLEVLGPRIDPVPAFLPPRPPHGARAPLLDEAAAWVMAARSLLAGGTVVAFDYGVPRTGELAMRPWREWLRTYRGHQTGGHYLDGPGTQDITVDVAFDQLPEPDALRTQAQWLALHGIDQLVEDGRQYWHDHAGTPDLTAIRMRSRVSEAEALMDPSGLGGFWAIEWRV